jgi:hypothetical protein
MSFGFTDYPFQWTNPSIKNGSGVLSIGKNAVRVCLTATYNGFLQADTFVRLNIGSDNISFTDAVPPTMQLTNNAVSNRMSGVLKDQGGNVVADSQFSAVMIAGAVIPSQFSWAVYVCSKSVTLNSPTLNFEGYSYITNPSPQSGFISAGPSSAQASYTYNVPSISFGQATAGFVLMPNTNTPQTGSFSITIPAVTAGALPGGNATSTVQFQVARTDTLPYFIIPAALNLSTTKVLLTNADGQISVASASVSVPRALFTDITAVSMWTWNVTMTYFSTKDVTSVNLAFAVPMEQAFVQPSNIPLPLG